MEAKPPAVSLPNGTQVLTRFQEFFQTESASGIVLMFCTLIALIWANSPLAASYEALWHTELTIGLEGFALTMDLHQWINDALMAIFFFLVGLEIKRELVVGELSNIRAAMLPILCALGGVIFPALIYTFINRGTDNLQGWGVPVATDIAFAIAVLSLLGTRVPIGLKVMLVALAIVDDLAAVVVIALFYTEQLNLAALSWALGGIALAVLFNRFGVMRALPYAIVGVLVWFAVLQSGVHATIAGVLMALCIPARGKINLHEYYDYCRRLLHRFEETVNPEPGEQELPKQQARLTHEQQDIAGALETASEQVQPPLDRLEHELAPWVAFGIMPLFALSNAGVHLPPDILAELATPVSLGVILGLIFGKQVGITLFAWLAVRLKLAVLPKNVSWAQIYAASWICGIGFTMSLFIAGLAFGDAARLAEAKMGILTASAIAGLIGFFILRAVSKVPRADAQPQPDQQAAS